MLKVMCFPECRIFLEMHDLLVKSKALQRGPEMLILLRFTSLCVFRNACILADSMCVFEGGWVTEQGL